MRFVPSSGLKPGMIIGRELYGYNNELMLAKGTILSPIEINRIKILKYQGVYIVDQYSENLIVDSGISEHLRNKAVKTLKSVFNNIGTDRDFNFKKDVLAGAMSVTGEIVQEITTNKNVSVNMIDLKVFDDYTYYHSVNVAVISVILGYAIGLHRNDLYKLGLGTLLHDIGKVFVPKELLNKPGKLTPEEFEKVKTHSWKGSDYLKEQGDIPFESNITVLTHHEKYDGSGYPNNLIGEKIPDFGRIAAVADVYDALTSDRPYRKGLLPSEGMEYIMGGSGTLFDPTVVNVFTKRIVPFPTGTTVLLSNGLKGIVVENHPGCGLRPKVQIICDSPLPIYYDLYNDLELLNITIIKIVEI
jgi:HD-GYP domain